MKCCFKLDFEKLSKRPRDEIWLDEKCMPIHPHFCAVEGDFLIGNAVNVPVFHNSILPCNHCFNFIWNGYGSTDKGKHSCNPVIKL